ncbi:MAG: hypothetical protein EBZ87_05820 [Microbacteriaceae bacterium]|nr:hypothetical protein [Microbacteriaceae bacterium]
MGFFATSGILNRKGFFGGQTFSPSSIAGLQLWLDATTGLFDATSGGNAVTTDGSAVARWEDQSGNGRNATQATLNNRPVLKTSIQNGKSGIRFDGSNDFMATASFAHSVPLTLFIVCKRLSNTGSQLDYNRIVEHGSNNGVCIITRSPSPPTGIFRIQYQYATYSLSDSLFDPATNTSIYEMFVDSSAPRNITFRVNNANQTSSTRAETPATPLPFNLAQFGNGSYNGNVEIYEVCYYNIKITDTDRDNVRNYLNSKWGVY